MGLVVNTNIQSIFAQRALASNTLALQRNIERLSTGFRINRAADDAAGLSISNKMTREIRGLEAAQKNAADGVSLIQTAEGGLGVIQDNLQRIRELYVQGLNGTNGVDEKNALQREINELITIIEDISLSTKFNGVSLLQPVGDITLQTGAEDGQTTTIEMLPIQPNHGMNIDIDATSGDGEMSEGASVQLSRLRIPGATLLPQSGIPLPGGTLSDVDAMINNISRMRSYLGAVQNALESKIQFMDIARENVSAARSRIRDVDVAKESSLLVRNQILQQTASAMLTQANTTPQIALQLISGIRGQR